MASIRRVSVLTSFAATAALLGALPGQASELALAPEQVDGAGTPASQALILDEMSNASRDGGELAEQSLAAADVETVDLTAIALDQGTELVEQPNADIEIVAAEVDVEVVDVEVVDVEVSDVEVVNVEISDSATPEAETEVVEAEAASLVDVRVSDEAVSTSAALLVEAEQVAALPADETAAPGAVLIGDPKLLAQGPGAGSRGISPVYLGVGGNIGIGDSANSAVGDFAFAVFGKFALGPRFAVRPALMVSEQRTSVTIPITYNFNTLQIQGFTLAPFIGGGVDISNTTGALINAGVDIPVSQQFTLTAQGNFRVSDNAGFGLLFGAAYNIPFFLR